MDMRLLIQPKWQVCSHNTASMFGEITAGSENILAVKIYPLDYPGLPSTEQLKALGDFYANGGPRAISARMSLCFASVGWDWVPPVRDRNMGIWLPVYLRTTGGVTIADPKLVTDLPILPDTGLAKLSLNLKLKNHNKNDENGKLTIIISPENFKGKLCSLQRI